jgi:hypothetical protein
VSRRIVDSLFKTALVALLMLPATLFAQTAQVHAVATKNPGQDEMVKDTLHITVYFFKNRTNIVDDYRNNGYNIHDFCYRLSQYIADPQISIDELVITGSASPEGPFDNNVRLAHERAHRIGERIAEIKGFDRDIIEYRYIPEDWDGLRAILPTLDQPWKDQAIEILDNIPQWETINGKQVESRKNRFKEFRNGEPWAWLDKNVFPDLRAAGGGISCVITRPAPKLIRDTIYLKPDTVYVYPPVGDGTGVGPGIGTGEGNGPGDNEPEEDYYGKGKKMIVAFRTNFAMIPLTNVGVEVPLSEHWSIGADWYSPWIWRKYHDPFNLYHKEDYDAWGWCFQFQAADIEARYWFTNHNKKPEQRLLGHSIGLYAAAGHYDFEWSQDGYQGEFYNAGIDYLYAWPIFKGKMHMEVELGLGCIYSTNQAYENIVLDDVCYRIPGERKIVPWIGPTRAQFSLVLPIYVNTGRKPVK